MKTFLLSLASILLSSSLFANTITAISNTASPGDWSSASTWSTGTVPVSGDIVLIPGGNAVAITTQIYGSETPTLSIIVTGTLNFEPSGKLNLSALSYIQLSAGGRIVPKNSSASQLITIGGILKYSAANNGTVTGPLVADVLSGLSMPGQPLSGFNVYVLPLQLINFSARESAAGSILSWQVSGSSTIDRFEVQRGEDGGNGWSAIGIINVGNGLSYNFEDRSMPKRTVVYRLKMIEKSGSFTYSPLVHFEKMYTSTIKMFPNPASGYLWISFPENLHGNISIVLQNCLGQVAKKMEFHKSDKSIVLNLEDVVKGIYRSNVYCNGQLVAGKSIVVQ